MNGERTKWFRRWDVAAITAMLVLVATVYTMAKHPMQWDQNTVDIADIKPRLAKVEANLQEVRDVNQAQMTMIIRELDGLHKDIKIFRESRTEAEHAMYCSKCGTKLENWPGDLGPSWCPRCEGDGGLNCIARDVRNCALPSIAKWTNTGSSARERDATT